MFQLPLTNRDRREAVADPKDDRNVPCRRKSGPVARAVLREHLSNAATGVTDLVPEAEAAR